MRGEFSRGWGPHRFHTRFHEVSRIDLQSDAPQKGALVIHHDGLWQTAAVQRRVDCSVALGLGQSTSAASCIYVRMGVIVGECIAWCDTMRPFHLALDPVWHGHGPCRMVTTRVPYRLGQAVVPCGVRISSCTLNVGRPPCRMRPPAKHCSSGGCCVHDWLAHVHLHELMFISHEPARTDR